MIGNTGTGNCCQTPSQEVNSIQIFAKLQSQKAKTKAIQTRFMHRKIMWKQAGAGLCQAQAPVDLPAEAEFILTVEFKIGIILEKASFAYFFLL